MTTKRHRFSKEIAEELLAEKGAFAHLYVLEELESQRSKATHSDLMWRDALAWLDELTKEDDVRGTTGGANLNGQGEEHSDLSEAHSENHVEATRSVSLHDGADGVGQ